VTSASAEVINVVSPDHVSKAVTAECYSDSLILNLYGEMMRVRHGGDVPGRWFRATSYDPAFDVCPIAAACARLVKLAANPAFITQHVLGFEHGVLLTPWEELVVSPWGSILFSALDSVGREVCNPNGMGYNGLDVRGRVLSCKVESDSEWMHTSARRLVLDELTDSEAVAEGHKLPEIILDAASCSFSVLTVLLLSAAVDTLMLPAEDKGPASPFARWNETAGGFQWVAKVRSAQAVWKICADAGFLDGMATALPVWTLLTAISLRLTSHSELSPRSPDPRIAEIEIHSTQFELKPLFQSDLVAKTPPVRALAFGASLVRHTSEFSSAWMLEAAIGFDDLDSLVGAFSIPELDLDGTTGAQVLTKLGNAVDLAKRVGASFTFSASMSIGDFLLGRQYLMHQWMLKATCDFGGARTRATTLGMETRFPLAVFLCEVPSSVLASKTTMQVKLWFDGMELPLHLRMRFRNVAMPAGTFVSPLLKNRYGLALCPRPVFGLDDKHAGSAFRDWLFYHLQVLKGVSFLTIIDVDGTAAPHMAMYKHDPRVLYIAQVADVLPNMRAFVDNLGRISDRGGHHKYVPALLTQQACYAVARSRGAAWVVPLAVDKFINSDAKEDTVVRFLQQNSLVKRVLWPIVYEHKMVAGTVRFSSPPPAKFITRQACSWEPGDKSWISEVISLPSHDLFFKDKCRGRVNFFRPELVIGEVHHQATTRPTVPSEPVEMDGVWIHHYPQMYSSPEVVSRWAQSRPDLWRRQFSVTETRLSWAVPLIEAFRLPANISWTATGKLVMA